MPVSRRNPPRRHSARNRLIAKGGGVNGTEVLVDRAIRQHTTPPWLKKLAEGWKERA